MTKQVSPKLLLTFIFLGGLLSGCPLFFIDSTLDLPPASPRSSSGGKGKSVTVLPFKDTRDIQDRIGVKKYFGAESADIFVEESVLMWLASRLSSELDSAGFEVTASPAMEERTDRASGMGTEIHGTLLKLFIEPIASGFTIEADLAVNIRVKRKDGLDTERQFFEKGVTVPFFCPPVIPILSVPWIRLQKD